MRICVNNPMPGAPRLVWERASKSVRAERSSAVVALASRRLSRRRLACALTIVFFAASAFAQIAKPGTTVPQGAAIPGIGSPEGPNGPGYLEFGGSRSDLTHPQPHWTDAYVRGVVNLTPTSAFSLEADRQARFGDSGYFGSIGLTHSFTNNLYANAYVGSSVGGFFLPKFRFDGFVNYKLLPRKQLVANLGFGYDRAKTVNSDTRYMVGATYYLPWPFIIQGGASFTHANPGSILATTYNLAVTEGHEKSHYITFRAELGREGYEVVNVSNPLVNFPIHNYSGTWRQWIGSGWGINFNFQRELNPYYNRNGATVGFFVDF
jgi:YaiO family outer membrane protein